jgi:uncharacterized protein (TIGR02646 family)
MADINQPFELTEAQKKFIEVKLGNASFTYKDWGEDDLVELKKAIREFYRNQQHGYCSYCRKDVSFHTPDNCHIEHIAPKSKYRDFIFEVKNLCVICAECNKIKRHQETIGVEPDTVKNGKKRKMYPRSSDAFLIIHPHFDNYDDHIEIFGDFIYGDKSEKGGNTIKFCMLNRRLRKFGWRRPYTDNAEIMETASKLLAETDVAAQNRIIEKLGKQLLLRR